MCFREPSAKSLNVRVLYASASTLAMPGDKGLLLKNSFDFHRYDLLVVPLANFLRVPSITKYNSSFSLSLNPAVA